MYAVTSMVLQRIIFFASKNLKWMLANIRGHLQMKFLDPHYDMLPFLEDEEMNVPLVTIPLNTVGDDCEEDYDLL